MTILDAQFQKVASPRPFIGSNFRDCLPQSFTPPACLCELTNFAQQKKHIVCDVPFLVHLHITSCELFLPMNHSLLIGEL